MRTCITATLLLLIWLSLPAQNPASAQAQEKAPLGASQAFSLKQAIQYGLANSPLVRNAQVDVDISKAKVGEIRSAGLPQINGTANYSYSPYIQQFVLEYGYGASFGPPPPTAVLGRPYGLALALPQNIIATAGLTQLIFSGSYIIGLRAASTYKELSNKQLTEARINLEASITRAYYQALVGREQISLLDENMSRLDSTMREARILFKNGFAEKIDVDRLEVARNNLASEKNSAGRSIQVAEAALKFQMNFPSGQPLTLSDRLQDAVVDAAVPAAAKDYDQRIEYSVLNTQEGLALLDLKNKKAGYLPTLAGFANVGYNSGASRFGNFNQGSYSQNVDGVQYSGQRWYEFAQMGLSLNVPIFDGFQKHYQIQQSKLTINKVRNGKELVRNQIDLENQVAITSLRNALERLDIQKRNLELAREVSRVTRIKVKNGIGSNLEVTTAESDLRQAQTNYYTTVYDVLVAKLDLELAGGRVSGN